MFKGTKNITVKKQEGDVNLAKSTDSHEQEVEKDWFDEEREGQLSVDIYGEKDNIVIKSAIAGVKPEDINIVINNDMITIRGRREQEEEAKEENYFYRECYWGSFSRSIILPVEVKVDKVSAVLKNGILTIILPKAKKSTLQTIKVKGGEENR